MNRGITQKQYLELVPPTEEDARSSQMRILDALKEKGITASFTLPALQKLYPICDEADYNITVSLAWNGSIWQAVDLEAGDTAAEHYGYAADLGSTRGSGLMHPEYWETAAKNKYAVFSALHCLIIWCFFRKSIGRSLPWAERGVPDTVRNFPARTYTPCRVRSSMR